MAFAIVVRLGHGGGEGGTATNEFRRSHWHRSIANNLFGRFGQHASGRYTVLKHVPNLLTRSRSGKRSGRLHYVHSHQFTGTIILSQRETCHGFSPAWIEIWQTFLNVVGIGTCRMPSFGTGNPTWLSMPMGWLASWWVPNSLTKIVAAGFPFDFIGPPKTSRKRSPSLKSFAFRVNPASRKSHIRLYFTAKMRPALQPRKPADTCLCISLPCEPRQLLNCCCDGCASTKSSPEPKSCGFSDVNYELLTFIALGEGHTLTLDERSRDVLRKRPKNQDGKCWSAKCP